MGGKKNGTKKNLEKLTPVIEREIARVMPRGKKPDEVYALLWDILDRGGKRFRPALCLLACEAVGGKTEKALPVAAAIELFHNLTLIHDDIEDDSLMRRGKSCLHVEHGIPLALNAGDGLFIMTLKALLRAKAKPKDVMRIQELLLDAFIGVLEGQGIELGWHRSGKWDVDEKDYERMVKGKTGVLIGAACEAGVITGRGSRRQRKALREFGECIGVAFQIQDDVLNLTGDEKKYKKEIGGDIAEGKRTLMVIHALRHVKGRKRERLLRLLKRKTRNGEEIKEIIGMFEALGSIEFAREYAERLARKAKGKLGVLDAKKQATKKLYELADFLIEREV